LGVTQYCSALFFPTLLANPRNMTFNMQMQDIFQTKPRLSHNDDETFRIKKVS